MIEHRNVSMVNMGVSILNSSFTLYGTLMEKKPTQTRFFDAVYVFIKKVDTNDIYYKIYELLCKYIFLLAGWLPEAAVCNIGHQHLGYLYTLCTKHL